jgi:arsenate reductase
MSEKVYKVLFVCRRNSARSIIAEAIMNREGGGKFEAWSAGSKPGDAIHPYVANLLEKLGYKTDGLEPKAWDTFAEVDAPELDFVFTLCDEAAKEPCPTWPSGPVSAHWSIPDPVKQEGTEAERRLAIADAYRMLHQRISIMMNLPIASLDKLSLKQKLDDIDKVARETTA